MRNLSKRERVIALAAAASAAFLLATFLGGHTSSAPVAAPEPPANVQAPAPLAPAEPATPPESVTSSGTVQKIGELQGALEIGKLQVAVEEQKNRLKELRGTATPAETPASAAAAAPAAPKRERVISVEGVDGHLTARLETPWGPQTVKAGDRYKGGGTVVAVTLEGVRLKGVDGALRRLDVEE